MRSSSFSFLALVFTFFASLAGCKGADGDTCKENDDCSGTLMCCRAVVSEPRGSCGVTCDMARDSGPSIDSGPAPDSGPVSDSGPMMSDVPVDATDGGPQDAAVDANDAGSTDAGEDAATDAASDGSTDAFPDSGVTDAGPDADAA
ncbi:MAG: hypothetical protein ACI9KE_003561 [Polyangiales bacterium]|jgi:hypothetical protein